MIGLLHGDLLGGSGSNLWTREVLRALARQGETVHVICQESAPSAFDFITQAYVYETDGSVETVLQRESPHPGDVILHMPRLGPLPSVYGHDHDEESREVVPMVELDDEQIEAYIARNVEIVEMVAREHGLTVLHANHTVLMSVVAQRVHASLGIPYAVMLHGSAGEHAVEKDARLHHHAAGALADARRIFVTGGEVWQRVLDVFPGVPKLDSKLVDLHVGVDTSLFQPVRPEARPASIEALADLLEGRTGGKRPDQTEAGNAALNDAPDEDHLLRVLAAQTEYDGKRPDEDAAEKLRAIDWAQERVLLFVGRLIASKGVHSVVAALPLILAREPETRLVIVGHGPFREVLELMLAALERGDRAWFEALIKYGSVLEESCSGPLAEGVGLLEHLRRTNRLDAYFQWARTLLRRDRVVFTGYLGHVELRHLFPCCDVAVFPSVVPESGPLVFLESLASGTFPLGTDFAGMGASIDRMRGQLDEAVVDVMRLSPDAARTSVDIAAQVPRAFEVVDGVRGTLRRIAVERYDWRSVARTLATSLGRPVPAEASA